MSRQGWESCIVRDDTGAPAQLVFTRPQEGPPLAVATAQRICRAKGCTHSLSGRQADYCSIRCKTAVWEADHPRMALLPFDPAPEPVMPLVTPAQIRASQKKQTVATLRMLQAGPCCTGDFIRAGIGRFGARIGELRAVGWQISMRKTGDHGATYRLEGSR